MDENLDPEQIKRANEELGNLATSSRDVSDEFGKTKDTTTDLEKSFKDLQKELKELQKLIKNDFIKEFDKSSKKAKQVSDDLNEFGNNVKKSSGATDQAASAQQKFNSQVKSGAETLEEFDDQVKKSVSGVSEFTKAFYKVKDSAFDFDSVVSQAAEGLKNNLSILNKLGPTAGIAIDAVAIGLQGLNKMFDATAEAQKNYIISIIGGSRGLATEAKMRADVAKASNDVTRNFAKLIIGVGSATVAFSLLLGPIGILTAALGVFAVKQGVVMQKNADAADRSNEIAVAQAAQMDKLFKGYNDLGKASMTTAGGMTELVSNMSKLRIPISDMDKFTGIVGKAGKELSMLGGSVTKGMEKFVAVSGELINSKLGDELRALGITNEEQAQYALNAMKFQKQLGLQEGKTAKEQAEYAAKYVKELDAMARLTGISREELEKEREAVLAMEEIQAALLEAEGKGDTKEVERLQAAIKASEVLLAQGRKEEATGLAQLAAGKGAYTEAAIKMQMLNPNAARMATQGGATPLEMERAVTKGSIEAAKRMAGTTKMFGREGAEALTFGNLKAIRAAEQSRQETDKLIAEKMAAKPGMTREQAELEFSKEAEAKDKLTKDAIAREEAQRMTAIANQMGGAAGKMEDAGQTLMGAVGKFAEVVHEWVTNNPVKAMIAALAGFVAISAGKKLLGGAIETGKEKLAEKFGGSKKAGILGMADKLLGRKRDGSTKALALYVEVVGGLDLDLLGRKGRGKKGIGKKLGAKAAAKAAAKTAATKGAAKVGTAALAKGAAGGAAKLIPGVGWVVAGAMGAYDAYQGYTANKDASTGDKLKNAGSSMLHGLTFGLLGKSSEEIAKEAEENKKAMQALQEANKNNTQSTKNLTDEQAKATNATKTATVAAGDLSKQMATLGDSADNMLKGIFKSLGENTDKLFENWKTSLPDLMSKMVSSMGGLPGGGISGLPGGPSGGGAGGTGGGGSLGGGGGAMQGPGAPQAHGQAGGGSGAPQLARVTSKTGKSASVNTLYADRFQGMIDWLEGQGYNIYSLGGYNDRDVTGQPGVKSIHAKGAAIDINPDKNPFGSKLITDMPEGVGEAAKRLGLGWGGAWSQPKDAMHFSVAKREGGSIPLSDGGLAIGSKSGYPATLHGSELVLPLNPNSILAELGKKSKSDIQTEIAQQTNAMAPGMSSEALKELTTINQSLLNMMETKFTSIIEHLSKSNNIQEDILSYQQQ